MDGFLAGLQTETYNVSMVSASTLRSYARRYWPGLAILAIVILILLNHQFQDYVGIRMIGTVVLVGIYIGAAMVLLRSSRTFSDPAVYQAWMFVSIGLILSVFAHASGVVFQQLSSKQLPVPSVVDLIRYAGLISIGVGFAVYPETRERIFGRLRALLDVGILCVGGVIVFWMVVLRPILLSGLVDTITAVWVEARVGFDLIWMILSLRLFLKAEERNIRAVFLLLSLGASIQTVVDLFSGFVRMSVIYPAPGILESGWLVAGFLILYGSSHLSGDRETVLSRTRLLKLNVSFRFEPLLPAAVTYIIIGFIALDWLLVGELDRVVLPIMSLMVILLIARQGVIAGQSEIRQHAELVNSTSDFAFTFNSKGNVRLANPALQSFLGLDPDQKSHPKVQDFLRVNLPLKKILMDASESGWTGEAQIFHATGKNLPVSLSIRRVQDEQRGPQLFAAIAHDLTETKVREEELRKTLRQLAETEEDLRRLNRELEVKVEDRTQELADMVSHLAQLNEELKALDLLKSDFVALVSHELRAPLTNIRTGLEVLLRGVPEFNQNARESLDLILKETDRLSSFVVMILDLSALEAGRFQLQVRPISAEKIIGEVVQRFSNQPGYERIHVELPDSLPLILADEQALHSILFHLIDNAIKYAPEGDVDVRVSRQEARVVICVMDCGPGIPPHERERVFEMFYRLDTRDSRSIYGRGLGLNLAKRFLDLMGGGIQISESDNGGAKVEFWLPHDSRGES